MVKKIQIFDPPSCCPTGACGPTVDPALSRFEADLDYIEKLGVEIERYNLAQQLLMFVNNPIIKAELDDDRGCLPLIIVDGKVMSRRKHVSREMLSSYAGIETVKILYTDDVYPNTRKVVFNLRMIKPFLHRLKSRNASVLI